MKKNLFVFAHYDDEAFSAGTIRKMVANGEEVHILIICGNGFTLDDDRHTIFLKNCDLLGATNYTLKYFDLTLKDLDSEVTQDIKSVITKLISNLNITNVYTNNGGDLHDDHKIVSLWLHTVCRPSISKVQSLSECYIPGANEYGSGIHDFTTVVDITDFNDIKNQCLLNYGTHLKGASSQDAAIKHSQYIGSIYNMQFAETFKTIWQKK